MRADPAKPSSPHPSDVPIAVTTLPVELHDMFLSYVTIKDVLAWRNTSVCTYHAATLFLNRRIRTLLSPFVPGPALFLDQLFQHRALIGGLFALAFFVVDWNVRFSSLDVYVPDLLYSSLVSAVEAMVQDNLKSITSVSTVYATSMREIVETTTFGLGNGRSIHLYRSSTWSALLPICRSPSSLLFNYVSQTSFGCAYPTLTLRHRGLLADNVMYHALPQDFYAMNALTDQGFDISWSPARFLKEDRIAQRLRAFNPTMAIDAVAEVIASELRAKVIDRPATYIRRIRPVWGVATFHVPHGWPFLQGSRKCFSAQNMCPQQVRFFGDGSSLIDFVDPLSTDRKELEDKCMAPFGPVVAWKLCSSYHCGGVLKCGAIDPEVNLLDKGFIHLPALSGTNRFDRQVARHHPPIYLYHAY